MGRLRARGRETRSRLVTTLRSIDELVTVVRATAGDNRPDADRRIIVGIVGSPGAGKSTIAAELVAALGAAAILLPMDGFHLPQSVLAALGRRDRMGAPDTFDVPGLLRTHPGTAKTPLL